MGAQLVKEVATKTNDVAGDGTTTATLLAQALVREGLKNVAAGANPMIVRKELSKRLLTRLLKSCFLQQRKFRVRKILQELRRFQLLMKKSVS